MSLRRTGSCDPARSRARRAGASTGRRAGAGRPAPNRVARPERVDRAGASTGRRAEAGRPEQGRSRLQAALATGRALRARSDSRCCATSRNFPSARRNPNDTGSDTTGWDPVRSSSERYRRGPNSPPPFHSAIERYGAGPASSSPYRSIVERYGGELLGQTPYRSIRQGRWPSGRRAIRLCSELFAVFPPWPCEAIPRGSARPRSPVTPPLEALRGLPALAVRSDLARVLAPSLSTAGRGSPATHGIKRGRPLVSCHG